MQKKIIYCSLDLEGTGLDPTKDHIIEAGAVLFTIDASGKVELKEEFGKLIKPLIPIPPFIQGLTHITEADVADAPPWDQVLPAFCDFVGDYPIVGHNVGFDLKFLESKGMPLTNEVIDTAEVARVFVPHARFFNLEHLFRHFKLELAGHHRALDDSKSTAVLLGRLVSEFHAFPHDIQKQAVRLLLESKLPYKYLFKVKQSMQKNVSDQKIESQPRKQGELFTSTFASSFEPLDVTQVLSEAGISFVRVPLSVCTAEHLAASLPQLWKQEPHSVVAVDAENDLQKMKPTLPGSTLVLRSPKEFLCETKFQAWLNAKSLPDEVVQFLIKVLLWRATTSNSDDLSGLRLYGNEFLFRDLITATVDCGDKPGHICQFNALAAKIRKGCAVVTSHAALLECNILFSKDIYKSCYIWDVGRLPYNFGRHFTTTFNLRTLRGLISLLFDESSGKGLVMASPKHSRTVLTILNQLDLNFGLLGIELGGESFASGQREIDDDIRDLPGFAKIGSAFGKLSKSLKNLCRTILEKEKNPLIIDVCMRIDEVQNFLKEFFISPKAENIYWLDSFGKDIKLKSTIRTFSIKALGEFESSLLFGPFSGDTVLNYLKDILSVPNASEITLSGQPLNVRLILPSEEIREARSNAILKEVVTRLSGRSLILFNSHKALEAAYGYFGEQVPKGRLLAQRATGHHWKNLEEFGKREDCAWLLSTQNFLKHIDTLPKISRLILVRLPYDIPDIEAASHDPDTVFSDLIIPRTVIRLEQILERTAQAKDNGQIKFAILDRRIIEDYNDSLLVPFRMHANADFKTYASEDELLDLLGEDSKLST